LYRTVVHLACTNTGATTEGEAFEKTWECFTNRSLKTWDGKPLYYYKDGFGWTNSATYTGPLLASACSTNPWAGHGQCGSFAYLLKDALAANGVNSIFTTVSTSNGNSFIVKDWDFPPPPPTTNVYPYKLTLVREVDWSIGMVPAPPGRVYGDFTKLDTLPGQNTHPPSEEWFLLHFIVKYGQLYYDPSYGATYTDTNDFEAKAVEGYVDHASHNGLDFPTRTAAGLHNIQFDHWTSTSTNAQVMRYIIPLSAALAITAIAQNTPASAAGLEEQRSLVLQSQQGPVTATQGSLGVQLPGGHSATIYMLYEPQNGYVCWEARSESWRSWATGYLESFTNHAVIVPDIGLVRFGPTVPGIVADVFTMRAPSLDSARQRIVAQLSGDADAAKANPPPRRVLIRLGRALGEEFFITPGHAEVGRFAEILSVAYTNQTYVVNLKSGLLKARAVVTLDRQFKLLSAIRKPD
jgi:hypothetical protein